MIEASFYDFLLLFMIIVLVFWNIKLQNKITSLQRKEKQ